MTHDILSRATRELKQHRDAGGPAPASTRTRVMMSLHRAERRRAAALYVLVPVAAVLAASTALAASGRLPAVLHTLGETLGVAAPPPPPPEAVAPVPVARTAAAPSPVPEAPIAPPPVLEAPVVPPHAEPRAPDGVAPPNVAPPNVAVPLEPHRATPVSAPARHPADSPPEARSPMAEARPVPSPSRAATNPAHGDDAERLYEAAHRSHFVDRDWNAALGAWDRYLAEAPRGRFVPEAKYNRAIALLRLGRRDEATRELTPFAQGAFGGYRQEEARSLLANP